MTEPIHIGPHFLKPVGDILTSAKPTIALLLSNIDPRLNAPTLAQMLATFGNVSVILCLYCYLVSLTVFFYVLVILCLYVFRLNTRISSRFIVVLFFASLL